MASVDPALAVQAQTLKEYITFALSPAEARELC